MDTLNKNSGYNWGEPTRPNEYLSFISKCARHAREVGDKEIEAILWAEHDSWYESDLDENK